MFFRQQSKWNDRIFLLTIFLVTYVLAYFLQTHLYINHDVAWLLEASKRMLAGGTYTKDFFENNPPFILYFYAPSVFLNKLLVNQVLSFQLYVFFLATLSLFLTHHFLKLILPEHPNYAKNPLIVLLSVLFLIFPNYEFGQREHLFFILITPYLFLMTLRLEKNQEPGLIVFAAVLAGLGLAIKPYFLMCLFLVEAYYIFRKRNWLAFARKDIAVITLMLCSYIVLVYMRHPDYLSVVLPYGLHWCYLGSKLPLSMLIFNGPVLFCLLACFIPLLLARSNDMFNLISVLNVALISFLIIYVMQKTLYGYHLLPALLLAVFNFVLVMFSFIHLPKWTKFDYVKIGVLASFAVVLIFYHFPIIWTIIIFDPNSYFIFFAALFVLLLSLMLQRQNYFFYLKIAISIIFILAMGYAFFFMSSRVCSHSFMLTTILLVLLFGLLAPKINDSRLNSVLLGVVGALIFSMPFYYMSNSYGKYVAGRKDMTNLIQFLQNSAKHRSLYFLSTNNFVSSLCYCMDISYPSRFQSFWMLPALVKGTIYNHNINQQQLSKDKNFLIDMVAEDLENKKPYFVFVDVAQSKNSFFLVSEKNKLVPLAFDYLSYFSVNTHFRAAWKEYRYLTTVENASFLSPLPYRFNIYVRKNSV